MSYEVVQLKKGWTRLSPMRQLRLISNELVSSSKYQSMKKKYQKLSMRKKLHSWKKFR